MASDFSRRIFSPTKHYSGVLMQQGRVQLDADWNEQGDLLRYRTETETRDVIGASGVPKTGGGFKVELLANRSDLTISPGRLYVDGLLCELEQEATYLKQPYLPSPDTTPFLAVPGSPPVLALDTQKNFLVYLEAWQREINFRDDPQLLEVALGEADTTTRLQIVWQIGLLPVANAAPTCQTDFPEWQAYTDQPTGTMAVQTKQNTDPKDPCSLPPTTGFRGLENQFYRVEVHQGGTLDKSTFKWSRDNASIETSILDINEAILTVNDLGKDSVLGFAPDQWVEVVDDESTLKRQPHPLIRIKTINPDTRQITLDGSADAWKGRKGLKLRRWDQPAAEIPITKGNEIELEDGIQVQFSDGTYRSGDYWTFTARTLSGNVESTVSPNFQPGSLFQPPVGPVRHFCRLGIIKAGASDVDNCRKAFPPLTNLTADDVSIQSIPCFPDVKNVQKALEELCARSQGQGVCTITPKPEPDWEKVFDQIGPGQDAQICFPVGEFRLQNPARLTEKGHLKLTGSGNGTRIIADNAETALLFERCASVLVRDLFVQTGGQAKNLNGGLTFIQTPEVNVEQVDLQCRSETSRTATCLTIRNDEKNPGSVRILNCDLQVDNLQQGILLVNVGKAWVKNNTIRTDGSNSVDVGVRLKDLNFRAKVRKLLFSNVTFIKKRSRLVRASRHNVQLQLSNGQFIAFTAPESLKNVWTDLLANNPVRQDAKPADALNHLNKLADHLLQDEAFRQNDIIKAVHDRIPNTMSQAITIGGRVAQDIHIVDNVIENCLQGIHVGLSHKGATASDIDQADRVTIRGNTITVRIHETQEKEARHGIFVGHGTIIGIENNTLQIERFNADPSVTRVEAIRVWGKPGPRLMIAQNNIVGRDNNRYWAGIHVQATNKDQEFPKIKQWVVMWNVVDTLGNPISLAPEDQFLNQSNAVT